jgi:Tol biopolymer transport system component
MRPDLILVRCITIAALLWTATTHTATPWDVTDTGQPQRMVRFTVTEGTWMSVTVSPDGETIIFDLLGDIYAIPSTGGDAVRVHGGPAMQRSPRFSPDGEHLLYLSDADGSDNVWISDADGSGARQVTEAAPDLLTGPAWSPDGRYLAAARFESTFPKLRASELRLISAQGGSGRVLVETPANGRDVQEAEFSPDGRFLYYTEKVTDPSIVVDANHINHVIKRRDLESGETTTLIGGFGGATSPRVSPDGRLLAFVRRVKARSVLFVVDLHSREQRPVYAELDRDLQADFVPHGNYYPSFDWFPDSHDVAIWGKGKLYRVNIDTGAASEIPFRADVEHAYTEVPRFSRELAPTQFRVRALRHPAVSPDGSSVTFHALGHLWQQSLPQGRPRRLGRAQAFEFEPAYSPDGRRLAFVTWDDETGGALMISAARGGRARELARTPGVVREPSFSADGSRIAYRVEGGNKIMGGYQARGGLYWVSADGGDGNFVREQGESPRFSRDGERIYYTRTESAATIYSDSVSVTRLESVTLNGIDVREHAVGPDTRELTISPDFRWITFKQHQQHYATPYLETGQPLELSGASNAVPVVKLTELGGYGMTWSADGSSLYWTLGPELFRADAASLLSGFKPPQKPYVDIEQQADTDIPQGALAFVHGRVITMQGDQVIDDGTVVVRGNRIVAVGGSADVTVPDDATVIDVSGKTVLPGLVDMHGHIDCCYPDGLVPQKQPTRYAALAFGITTNFDPYSSELPHYAAAEMTLSGATIGPRFIGSGSVIYGRSAKPDFTYDPVDDYQDAARIMARKRALGGTIIKSYKQPMRSQRQLLVNAAREAGLMVDAEGENHFYNNITMVLDGHTILEHNLPVATYYDDIVQLMAHGDTANTPTLIVTFGEVFGENYLYQTTRAWDDPKVRRYVQEVNSSYSALDAPYAAPPHVRGMTTLQAADEIYDIGFRSVARSIRKLDAAGVLINAGSHGQIPGLAMHWEMWLLAEGGMSNLRVLRAATLNGATSLGLSDQIGSLAPGKLADLIVLDGNPLDDIRQTNSVRYTLVNGRLYDALSLDEIGNHPRPRSRFYWELPDYQGIDWNESWAGQ